MKTTAVALAALAAVAHAQDPSAVSKFFADLGQYYQSLQSDPNFLSAAGGLITASPDVVSSLQALQTATDLGALTAPPSIITALPSPYNSLFLSVYNQEIAIASRDGIISDGKIASGAGSQISSMATNAASALASSASDMSASMSMSGSMMSESMSSAMTSMSGSMSGSMMSASMSATSAASASASPSGGSTSSSRAGAPAPTGVMAMGVAAGIIGGIAALL